MFVPAFTFAQGVEAEAPESPLKWSLEAYSGVFYGGANEYVFVKGEARELSRLEWEEHWTPFFGIKPALTFKNFFAELDLLGAVSTPSGKLRDYDYKIPGNGELTNFSEHEAVLDKHFEIKSALGYNFTIAGVTALSAGAGFAFRSRKWSGENGYYQYPPGGAKVKMTGLLITYNTATYAPFMLLGAAASFNERFEIALRALVFPYIFFNAADTHYQRELLFADTIKGGAGVSGTVSFKWTPKIYAASWGKNFFSAAFKITYEDFFRHKGITGSGKIGGGEVRLDPDDESGMESRLWSFSVSFIWSAARLKGINSK